VHSRQKLDSEIVQNSDTSSGPTLPQDFSFAQEYQKFMNCLARNFSSVIPEQGALLSERIATNLEVMHRMWGTQPDYVQLWQKFEGLKSFGPMHTDNWTVNIVWEWSSMGGDPTEVESSPSSAPPSVGIATVHVDASTTHSRTTKSVFGTAPLDLQRALNRRCLLRANFRFGSHP
jgi:hypothetical protein